MTSPADQFHQRTIAEFRTSRGPVGGNFAGIRRVPAEDQPDDPVIALTRWLTSAPEVGA